MKIYKNSLIEDNAFIDYNYLKYSVLNNKETSDELIIKIQNISAN